MLKSTTTLLAMTALSCAALAQPALPTIGSAPDIELPVVTDCTGFDQKVRRVSANLDDEYTDSAWKAFVDSAYVFSPGYNSDSLNYSLLVCECPISTIATWRTPAPGIAGPYSWYLDYGAALSYCGTSTDGANFNVTPNAATAIRLGATREKWNVIGDWYVFAVADTLQPGHDPIVFDSTLVASYNCDGSGGPPNLD